MNSPGSILFDKSSDFHKRMGIYVEQYDLCSSNGVLL